MQIETGRDFLIDVRECRLLNLLGKHVERQRQELQIAATCRRQRGLIGILIAQYGRPAIPAVSRRLADLNTAHRTGANRSILNTSLRAIEFASQNDVDNASNGVRTVDR